MVLLGLALSILGLFRYMRHATPAQPDLEVIALREDDRVQREIHAALGSQRDLVVMERGLDIQDRDTHFMSSARAQAPLTLHSTSSKRKLDDYEIGVTESSVSATSQVGENLFCFLFFWSS